MLCNKCHVDKNENEFYLRRNSGPIRPRQPCKACANRLRISGRTRILKKMVTDARTRAGKKGLPFSITEDDVLSLERTQQGLCALTGWMLEWAPAASGRNPHRVSIDRIDSSKGYTMDNIQLVCDMVNMIKKDMNNEEFIGLCKAVYQYHI